MSLDMWVFDVGRGLCVAFRTPNGYLYLVDCGCSDDFSPIGWLSRQTWTRLNGYSLAKLVITHPHCDHIADIATVTALLQPSIILRRKDLDWSRVTSSGSDTSAEMRHYVQTYMPPQYNEPATIPDWGDGCGVESFNLDVAKISEVSKTDSAYVNNSSLVTIVLYKGYCLAVTGDIEAEGMAALLRQSQGLRGAIAAGVHFLVTPHHGHPSGFSVDWFAASGPTKIMNIASERRRTEGEDEAQTSVDSRYSQDGYCAGNNREGRKLVSTKTDGHIHVCVADDGKWDWQASK